MVVFHPKLPSHIFLNQSIKAKTYANYWQQHLLHSCTDLTRPTRVTPASSNNNLFTFCVIQFFVDLSVTMTLEEYPAELADFRKLLVQDVIICSKTKELTISETKSNGDSETETETVGASSEGGEGTDKDTVNSFLSDRDCMRFLRARNMNVKKAATMAHKWWEWYNTPLQGGKGEAVSPRHILDIPEDPNEEIYRRLMPHSNMGEDKEGRCVYWEQTGDISSRFTDIIKELTVEEMVIRHVRQQEIMVKRLEAASVKHDRPIEKQIIVFNLANLSYSVDFNAMNTFKQTVVIDEAYYPERLKHFFMINAPWFFTAIWAMLKPFIDPVTASKINIVGSDYLDTLREHIDDSQIPEDLGGSFKMIWEWPYRLPNEDDKIKQEVPAAGDTQVAK